MLLDFYNGIRIFGNIHMTETEEYEDVVVLSFRQRWVEPLLHGITMPFEPWVKTRAVTRTRTIPSRKILQTPQGLIMHPAMICEVTRMLQKEAQLSR